MGSSSSAGCICRLMTPVLRIQWEGDRSSVSTCGRVQRPLWSVCTDTRVPTKETSRYQAYTTKSLSLKQRILWFEVKNETQLVILQCDLYCVIFRPSRRMNFQQNVTRLIIIACQGADRRLVKSYNWCYANSVNCNLYIIFNNANNFRSLSKPLIMSLLFFSDMMCVSVGVWVGVQDMAGGRMGQDAGRNFSWAHAGAHPDEVHLHKSIWVWISSNITLSL